MAAYAAVLSLHHTINALLNSCPPRVSSIREILESANEDASYLLQVLEALNGSNRSRSSMERVDALEAQIRDSAHKLEDVLEYYELKQLEEEEKEEEDGDEEGVMRQEILSFGEAAKRLEKDYLAELSRDDDNDEDTTYPDFGVEMIGRSRLFKTILNRVIKRMRPDDRYVFTVFGEQGSGSRFVVKTVYENAREAGKFERYGWTRVGPGSELKDVLMSLIPQVEVDVDNELLVDATDDRLSEYMYKALEHRSYMIVLDGVEDVELLSYLRTKSFPDESNGSVILVTTFSRDVLQTGDVCSNYVLSDVYVDDLWLCARHVLFKSESIPVELEVAGKEIVRNCRCLYVTLARTIVFLSKSDKTVEQWNKIAADKDNPIFTVEDEILEIGEIQKEEHLLGAASYMISFSPEVENVTEWMNPERFFFRMQIISFSGMAGIGKTTFVRNIFEGNPISRSFDHRVWIYTGPRYRTEEILVDILTRICPNIPKLQMNDERLAEHLCAVHSYPIEDPIEDVSLYWMTCVTRIPYIT